jgi:hypothetical protein
LEELRPFRTLAAAVRELKRKDPVKWATQDEGYNPCREPLWQQTQSAASGHRQRKNTVLQCILVPVPHRTKIPCKKKRHRYGILLHVKGMCSQFGFLVLEPKTECYSTKRYVSTNSSQCLVCQSCHPAKGRQGVCLIEDKLLIPNMPPF